MYVQYKSKTFEFNEYVYRFYYFDMGIERYKLNKKGFNSIQTIKEYR